MIKYIKKFIAIVAIVFIFAFSGCQQENQHDKKTNGNLLENGGLQKYLKNEPTVRSVKNWPNNFSDGLIIRTKHYKIYTTLREPLMLRQVPGFLESAFKGYQNQLGQQIETETPLVVYLFGKRSQWEEFTKDFTKPNQNIYLKIQRGAYYLNGACVAYNIGRKHTFNVLGHEAWHQFSSRYFKYRLPSWLDEGIAMHFESHEYKGGFFKFTPSKNLNRIGTLKLAMAQRQLIPIETLITLNPGQVLVHGSNSQAAYFYAQAYSLVRFLRESHYGKRLYYYNQMLEGGLNGTWPLNNAGKEVASNRNIMMTARNNALIAKSVFESYIGNDYNTLQSEYINFCNKLTSNIIINTK